MPQDVCCRATILMGLAHAIGAMTMLEQPVHLSTGGMQTHERFRAMCRLFTASGSISNAAIAEEQLRVDLMG